MGLDTLDMMTALSSANLTMAPYCLSLPAGENLVQKWQVLTEVLTCSERLVGRLGRLGNVSEAKAFCLEALKLTTKLQIPRQ